MSAPTQGHRPVDESMELLNTLLRETVDPEYGEVAAREPRSRSRRPWLVVIVGAVAGLMFATSGLGSGTQTPSAAAERADLIEQVDAAEQRNEDLRAQAEELQSEVNAVEAEHLGTASPDDVTTDVWSGGVAVSGPGVVITINDNPNDANGIIVDQDVRQVVNGLWLAGAEAIAINGHRLSARTAIRQAGSAVTVDYRSMTTPYRFEAIGSPGDLSSAFASNSGGAWLTFLKQNYGVTWSLEQKGELELSADAGLDVDRAGVP
ncbi:DUF881 domain-containing protein [Brooklawnia cerclae]|uniref:Uncharacterized protein YlxW (UPF0749 family) n=1 Tax=Brooklawnia cerclae TaxID=349934 RepID=A0ABX0SEN8_9ACTN|nr:DUF881 domain-containing protein [Brooklawnia cerclae]NIH56852.1 uncharacterized protein YlxW (UPF0749 family) [Brooklawnia cerclae]